MHVCVAFMHVTSMCVCIAVFFSSKGVVSTCKIDICNTSILTSGRSAKLFSHSFHLRASFAPSIRSFIEFLSRFLPIRV